MKNFIGGTRIFVHDRVLFGGEIEQRLLIKTKILFTVLNIGNIVSLGCICMA